jgi:hypothetical protein
MTEIHKSQSVAILTSLEILKSLNIFLNKDSLKSFFTTYNDLDSAEVVVDHRLPDGKVYSFIIRLKMSSNSWKTSFVMGWYNSARDCDWTFESDGSITVNKTYGNDIELPKRILKFAKTK